MIRTALLCAMAEVAMECISKPLEGVTSAPPKRYLGNVTEGDRYTQIIFWDDDPAYRCVYMGCRIIAFSDYRDYPHITLREDCPFIHFVFDAVDAGEYYDLRDPDAPDDLDNLDVNGHVWIPFDYHLHFFK